MSLKFFLKAEGALSSFEKVLFTTGSLLTHISYTSYVAGDTLMQINLLYLKVIARMPFLFVALSPYQKDKHVSEDAH